VYGADKVWRAATLELATLEWVAWFNHQRLHSAIGYIPPAEAEANYMAVCWQSCGRAAVDRRR